MNPLSTVDGDNGDMLQGSQIVLTVVSIVSHLRTKLIYSFLIPLLLPIPRLVCGVYATP